MFIQVAFTVLSLALPFPVESSGYNVSQSTNGRPASVEAVLEDGLTYLRSRTSNPIQMWMVVFETLDGPSSLASDFKKIQLSVRDTVTLDILTTYTESYAWSEAQTSRVPPARTFFKPWDWAVKQISFSYAMALSQIYRTTMQWKEIRLAWPTSATEVSYEFRKENKESISVSAIDGQRMRLLGPQLDDQTIAQDAAKAVNGTLGTS